MRVSWTIKPPPLHGSSSSSSVLFLFSLQGAEPMAISSLSPVSRLKSPVLLATPTSTASQIVQTAIPTNGLESSSVPSSSYLTTSSSSIIACLSLIIALVYLVVLSWGHRVAHENPRPLNKSSGPRVQRYAPVVYAFVVLTSLVEVAISSWLIVQYGVTNAYPRHRVQDGISFLLFVSTWTFLTAGVYSLLFLHPTWSKHSISSIGAQGVWSFVTWLFWTIGSGIINSSLPEVIDKGNCKGIVHCLQLRLLFGIAVVESLLLTASLGFLVWLAYHSVR